MQIVNNFKANNVYHNNVPQFRGKQNSAVETWKFYTEDGFETLLEEQAKNNKEIKHFLNLMRTYGIKLSLSNLSDTPIMGNVVTILNENIGIDLTKPPKVYRFISDDELNALKRDGKILPKRRSREIDVTINPKLNWNRYRLTFKDKSEFSIMDKNSRIKSNPGSNHEGFYLLQNGYNLEDIETIEEYNGYDYVRVL